MPDLDPAGEVDLPPTAGTGIALADHAQIGIIFNLKIPSRIYMAKVIILPICPHDDGARSHERIIGDDPGLDADCACKTSGGTGHFENHVIRGEFQGITTQSVPDLHLVYLAIPADQYGHWLTVRSEDQGLDNLFRSDMEVTADLFNRPHPGGVNLLKEKSRSH